MVEETTTIQLKKTTWTILNAHKKCGESMDDVVMRLTFGNKIPVLGEPMNLKDADYTNLSNNFIREGK